MSFKPDPYQQAYLDYVLPPKSITRVIANAGSGKSTTIASKTAQLILNGTNEENILAITFTNRSAFDLKNKIKQQSKVSIKYCSTIHGLSIALLKANDVKPTVMNEWQSLLLIRKVMETNNLSTGTKKDDTTLARDFLSKFNTMRSITYDCNPFEFPLLEHFNDITINLDQFVQVYVEYDMYKRSKNLWDFQDLISPRAEKLIVKRPEVEYFFLDECQDTSYDQWTFLFNMFHDSAITLVGDIKQELYCIDVNSEVEILHNGEVKNVRIEELNTYPIDGSVKVMSRQGWSTFTQYIPKGVKETIKIEMEDGRFLICTPDHKIETYNRGWVEAQHLTEDDDVITKDNVTFRNI